MERPTMADVARAVAKADANKRSLGLATQALRTAKRYAFRELQPTGTVLNRARLSKTYCRVRGHCGPTSFAAGRVPTCVRPFCLNLAAHTHDTDRSSVGE